MSLTLTLCYQFSTPPKAVKGRRNACYNKTNLVQNTKQKTIPTILSSKCTVLINGHRFLSPVLSVVSWFVKLEKNTRDHQWNVIKWKMEPKINTSIGNYVTPISIGIRTNADDILYLL